MRIRWLSPAAVALQVERKSNSAKLAYCVPPLGETEGSPARHAVRELRAAAAFRDWNPAHFPDVAEWLMLLPRV